MRKINYSKTDAISFMNDVINSKKKRKSDLSYKERCIDILNSSLDRIKLYDSAFYENSLETLDKERREIREHNDFVSLYDYDTKPFKILKEQAVIDENKRRNDDCPICGLNKVNTLDHFLPKEEFVSYSIHPRNLIPCCSRCNSHKSKSWHDNGKRKIWNVYLNELPQEKYLFCSISMNNEMPIASYYIKQGKLKNEVYEIIESTFNKLHLIQYYNEASDKIITDFIRIIKMHISLYTKYNIDDNIELIRHTIDNCDVNDRIFVLQDAFLSSKEAIDYIKRNI